MSERDAGETIPGMAEAIEARRKELHLSVGDLADAAGITPMGLKPLREGIRRDYRIGTLHGLAAALRWKRNWFDLLLAGADPAELEDDGVDRTSYDATMSTLSDEARSAIDLIIEADQARRSRGR